MNSETKIFCDGGARGNPGPGASAFIVYKDNKLVYKKGLFIHTSTNNVAEYKALVMALEWVLENKQGLGQNISIYTDSELMKKQMSKEYKVKNETLRKYFLYANDILDKIKIPIKIIHIKRELNYIADGLVNKTIDEN